MHETKDSDGGAGVEYAVKGLPPLVKNCREELENIRAALFVICFCH